MAIGWFIAPYQRILPYTGPGLAGRKCAMDNHTATIRADGGDWREVEVLGNRAVVKVRASAATLTSIATATGWRRLPKDRLDDPLSDLTNQQKNALRSELQDMGYTLAEIQARFGNDLGAFTLGDVLRFMAKRRRKPRYDAASDAIVLDGDEVTLPANAVDALDGAVV